MTSLVVTMPVRTSAAGGTCPGGGGPAPAASSSTTKTMTDFLDMAVSNRCIKQTFERCQARYTGGALLRDLPPRGRWYILSVIALGALTFAALVSRAALTPVIPLVFLVLLSSLTSAFKIQFPIASGSNMSVSY